MTRDFDSHICFASAHPIKLANDIRICTRVCYRLSCCIGAAFALICPVHSHTHDRMHESIPLPTQCCPKTLLHSHSDYFGGDGPHYSPPYPNPLHRNSSFGVATLRPDGFVGVRPKPTIKSDAHAHKSSSLFGTASTVPLLVTGNTLLITADTAPSGNVTVVAHGAELPGGAVTCGTVSGRNVTDEIMGCDLTAVVGKTIVLNLMVRNAVLFVLGFTKV